ncbi:hypothetical protein TNCV_503011 [Trichonephila clavipes]|nr:hypothetical protein TNCV_503011 [Trichonephila clavipes]
MASKVFRRMLIWKWVVRVMGVRDMSHPRASNMSIRHANKIFNRMGGMEGISKITPFLYTRAPLKIAGYFHLTSPRQPMIVRKPNGWTPESRRTRATAQLAPPLSTLSLDRFNMRVSVILRSNGQVVAYLAFTPQVRGSILGLGKTDHLIGISAHAHQRSVVTYTKFGTLHEGGGPRILNHGQVTSATSELASLFPNLHIIPIGGCLSLDRFSVYWPLGPVCFQWYEARTRDMPVTSP